MTMSSKNQIINSINKLSVNEKLLIVEAILKSIREKDTNEKQHNRKPEILELAGSITENEATEWQNAINDGRQIDLDGMLLNTIFFLIPHRME